MTNDEIRSALKELTKDSRKAIAQIALEMETNEPARYEKILAKNNWEGEALRAYKAYKRAMVLSRMAMLLAAVAVLGGFVVGDFGLQLLTGWLNRYALAGGIVVGMSLLAGGLLLLNSQKERLIAYGILEGIE